MTAEKSPNLPRVTSLDDDGFPLIPFDELPFMGYFTRGKQRYFNGNWQVDAPTDFNDAQLLGQEMALSFLRVAPIRGEGTRQAHMDWIVSFILSDQAKAIQKGGHARAVIAAFWGTVARFAEPMATLVNVEHWRGVCRKQCEREKAASAEYMAAAAKEQSERARHAANARWAKRSKQS